MIKFLTAIFNLIALHRSAQLVDLTRRTPYLAVFATTVAFDSFYLTILERSFHQTLPDTLKLATGYDLADYWHTRNLSKAYTLACQFLAIARAARNKVWEGWLQKSDIQRHWFWNRVGKFIGKTIGWHTKG